MRSYYEVYQELIETGELDPFQISIEDFVDMKLAEDVERELDPYYH